MRKLLATIFGVAAGVTLAAQPSAGVILQLTLYNSVSVLDENDVPLLGSDSSGDLLQVILAGANHAIDDPALTGAPAGDDAILFTAHLGLGVLPEAYDQGFVAVWPVEYDSVGNVGDYFYVRFWNDSSLATATYYGNSSLFQLPEGDFWNQAVMDFVPFNGNPHKTDTPFNALVIPEPSSLFIYGISMMGVWWLWRRAAVETAAKVSAPVAVSANYQNE